MIDRFNDGLLTPTKTSSYLEIPLSTLSSWLKNKAAGAPLVHRVELVRKGQPSVPFVASRSDAIHRAIARGGPAAYVVRADRIEQTWP